jgi:hypothetical protein
VRGHEDNYQGLEWVVWGPEGNILPFGRDTLHYSFRILLEAAFAWPFRNFPESISHCDDAQWAGCLCPNLRAENNVTIP